MPDDVVPVPVDLPRRPSSEDPAPAVGRAAAGMLDYLIGVLDREDRLESGSGMWRAEFSADEAAAPEAIRSAVLRVLRFAMDDDNHSILELLSSGEGMALGDLALKLGSGRLPVAERISDLVSAGLVVKLPEAGQVRATEAARAIVRLVGDATRLGVKDLRSRGT